MLSFKNFALLFGALVAVSAICVESHFNQLHGRNGAELGIGIGGLGGLGGIGGHVGIGLPIGIPRRGGQLPPQTQPTRAPSTVAPSSSTTGRPTICPVCPINRRCGPMCDQHAFQANVQAFKQAGCCVATPCQMRGNQADYDDFKSYVCSRNFNC